MIRTHFFIIAILFFFIQNIFSQKNVSKEVKIIKIGMLISDEKSLFAKNAAELAIEKANEKERKNGLQFQLVVRSMDGAWGIGSKQAVDLIFNEKVWAIIGSHNGRNAHLVEQVISKTRIVFLSAWASDPTLSQAFVPWYFSCVPNDNQQAKALVDEIYNNRRITKISTISDLGYDSKLGLQSFLRETEKIKTNTPLQLFYKDSNKDFIEIIKRLNKESIQGVIFFGQPANSTKFFLEMKQKKMKQQVFGTLSLMGEDEFNNINLVNYENLIIANYGNWMDSDGFVFRRDYQKKYRIVPNAVAAYSFDSVNMIIEAIKKSSYIKENLQKELSTIQYNGVTGTIQFDNKGNRKGKVGLVKIKNGIPVTIK
ncbi:ABC transporter substrate-binding protein [Lutibacter sp.]|uniref:ABC transporter substrate-binding protein n=1 Tax=Lutibacter sp. TaxID=1925666 RepID=UPI002735342B|nr:ABC transporter substrate-binding protein [Lutibacter sp.]MDP3314036.1 ABC transporter substrate-binding protein [Lutibacter sp.]